MVNVHFACANVPLVVAMLALDLLTAGATVLLLLPGLQEMLLAAMVRFASLVTPVVASAFAQAPLLWHRRALITVALVRPGLVYVTLHWQSA